MLPARDRAHGTKNLRSHALGTGAALIAMLFAASCAPAPTGDGDTGGGSSSGGSSGSSNTGGRPNGGSNTGGTPSGGSSSGGTSGGSSSGGTSGGSSSGGTSGGGSGGTSGGSPDVGGGSTDTPTTPVNPGEGLPTCTEEPAATPPALKRTLVGRIPDGDEAGQVIGVPGEKGIYILGHTSGKIWYSIDGKTDPTPMATLPSKSNPPQSEQGLLGMALHPDFAKNKLFYAVYTSPNIRIDELERTGPTSSKLVRTIWDGKRVGGGAFHNGGQIWFNPKDGGKPLLYHAVGNTASVPESGKPEGTAGRVLIHDLSGQMPTAKTMSFGLRNPYRMSIDRATGDMYMGEVDDPKGGAIYFSSYASPVKDYGYRGGGIKAGVTGKEGDSATIGGIVYRGKKIAGICGRYFYASWPGGNIKSLVMKGGQLMGGAATHAGLGVGKIASFGEDGEGEMYVATQGSQVFKIEAM